MAVGQNKSECMDCPLSGHCRVVAVSGASTVFHYLFHAGDRDFS